MAEHPGFLAVHNGGLRGCRGAGERLALLWLSEQGAHYGYGEPFPATNADLVEESGRSKGWVALFLERMAASGVLRIVHPGDRRSARLVSMVDPFPKKHDQSENQEHDQGSDHRKQRKGRADRLQADQGDDQRDDQHGHRLRDQEEEEKIEKEKEKKKEDNASKSVWEYWKGWHKKARVFRNEDRKFVNARLSEGHTVQQLCSIVKWAHEGSDHYAAQVLQKGGHLGLSTLMKPTKFDTRLELADVFASGEAPKPTGGATHGDYVEPEGFMAEGRKAMEAYWDEQDRIEAEAKQNGAEA